MNRKFKHHSIRQKQFILKNVEKARLKSKVGD